MKGYNNARNTKRAIRMASKSRKILKTTILALTTVVLLGTFATFAVLFFSYQRGDDENNEDAICAQAEKAVRDGDPLAAMALYHRLMALNPFESRYENAYLHTLMAARDFETLAAATNGSSTVFAPTAEETAVEAAIARGVELLNCRSNELAVATFASVTNLNAFSVTPFLVQALASAGQPELGLTVARDYTARFPHPAVLLQALEWSALARRRDLVDECRTRALRIRGRVGLSLARYCDALAAWLDDNDAELSRTIKDLDGEIPTPLARLLLLRHAAQTGTAETVERAYDAAVAGEPANSRVISLARNAVKVFLANHFPNKVTLDEILRLTALINDPENPDVDILRLSILAKHVRGTLLKQELEEALRRFPNDRGLLRIRDQQAR